MLMQEGPIIRESLEKRKMLRFFLPNVPYMGDVIEVSAKYFSAHPLESYTVSDLSHPL